MLLGNAAVVGSALFHMLTPSGTVFRPVCAIRAVRICMSVWLGQQYIVFPWDVCKVLSSSKLARLNLSFLWSACVQTGRRVYLPMDQVTSVTGLEWGCVCLYWDLIQTC